MFDYVWKQKSRGQALEKINDFWVSLGTNIMWLSLGKMVMCRQKTFLVKKKK